MSRKLFALTLFLAMLGISACRDATTKMSGPQAAPPLGYLEHRNHQYPIRDLMDPSYRAHPLLHRPDPQDGRRR